MWQVNGLNLLVDPLFGTLDFGFPALIRGTKRVRPVDALSSGVFANLGRSSSLRVHEGRRGGRVVKKRRSAPSFFSCRISSPDNSMPPSEENDPRKIADRGAVSCRFHQERRLAVDEEKDA